ncbi:MAG: hypothetical protein RL632_1521 [Bacteroidota bacterium]
MTSYKEQIKVRISQLITFVKSHKSQSVKFRIAQHQIPNSRRDQILNYQSNRCKQGQRKCRECHLLQFGVKIFRILGLHDFSNMDD